MWVNALAKIHHLNSPPWLPWGEVAKDVWKQKIHQKLCPSGDYYWYLHRGANCAFCSFKGCSQALFPFPFQKTLSGLLCILSPECALDSSWHCWPWCSGCPAEQTANAPPPKNLLGSGRATVTAATVTTIRTPLPTCLPAGTAGSRGLWTWTSSRRRRSWSELRGWRSGSASSGRSGWTASRTSQGPGASTATTRWWRAQPSHTAPPHLVEEREGSSFTWMSPLFLPGVLPGAVWMDSNKAFPLSFSLTYCYHPSS